MVEGVGLAVAGVAKDGEDLDIRLITAAQTLDKIRFIADLQGDKGAHPTGIGGTMTDERTQHPPQPFPVESAFRGKHIQSEQWRQRAIMGGKDKQLQCLIAYL